MAEKAEEEGKPTPAGGSVSLSLAAVGMGQVPLTQEEANWGGGCWINEEDVPRMLREDHEDDVDKAWLEVPTNEIAPW